MALTEVELEKQLKEAGSRLLDAPPSVDELLNLLDKIEHLLINVGQAPSRTMQDALLPPMKALISTALLRHSDSEVQISVASCLSEITRITAPDAPYNDEQMKEIFGLTVAAFEKLSHASSHSYRKTVSILETVAKVRSCLVMLDLELDGLVLNMFQHFLRIIRSDHPPAVYLAMKTIMTLVIDESEAISLDLLLVLLSSVRKEVQDQSPLAWKLGTKVISNCGDKLKPYVKEAVRSGHIALDEYGLIVTSLCQEHVVTNGLSADSRHPRESGTALNRNAVTGRNGYPSRSLERCSLMPDFRSCHGRGSTEEVGMKLKMELETDRKKGRKRNSLMNTEEGYDHSCISTRREYGKPFRGRKPYDPTIDESIITSLSPKGRSSGGIHSKKGQPKKKESITNQHIGPRSLSLSKGMILGARAVDRTNESDGASLSRQSKDRSKSEVKRRKQLSKYGLSVLSGDRASRAPEYMELERRAQTQGESNQPLKLVIRKKSSSLVQMDAKNSPEKATSDEHNAEASHAKKAKSLIRRRSDQEESPKTGIKRKHSPKREEPSEIPDLGEQLIGSRIKVWWPMDKTFYEGVVTAFDPIKKKHKISYVDGDEEVLNLRKQRWELIGNVTLIKEGQEADLSKRKDSSDVNRAASISKAKKGRGRKSADGATRSRRKVVNKPMDEVSSPDVGSKANGEKSHKKSKIKSSSAGINSKQRSSEILNISEEVNPEGMDDADGIKSKLATAETRTLSDDGSAKDGNEHSRDSGEPKGE